MSQIADLFSSSDFSGMRFNPFGCESLKEKYPVLGEINIDEKSLAFIAYMYDPGTPLRGRFPEMEQRVSAAAELSEMEDLGQMWSEDWVTAVVEFLRAANNRLWTMIISNEETFYEYARRALSPVSTSDDVSDKDILQAATIKSKLLGDMNEIDDRLTGYYRRLTGEDNKLIDAIRVRRLSPEAIAKQARNV